MSDSTETTHILIIPFPAPGHILPLMDLTYQLAIRGNFTITVVVTPKNLEYLNPLLSLHTSIHSLVFPFPSHPSVPAGVEQMQDVISMPDIVSALSLLYGPILQWYQNNSSPPLALLSDMLLSPWTHRLAAHLGIKDILYNALSTHSLYSWFVQVRDSRDFSRQMYCAAKDCWGVVNNCFAQYSGKYMELLKTEFVNHERVWDVGPLLPVKASSKCKSESSNRVIEWLDSLKFDSSVVYIAFGSQIALSLQQMEAIANALEESAVNFIWVVKESAKGSVPDGFEDRVAGTGLVIRGWVPQVAILEHRAVGVFLNHLGWNSLLEGLLADVLMLAWPMQIDHFCNDDMLVDEMGVAIRVCEGLDTVPDAKKLAQILKESVCSERPERMKCKDLRRIALDAIKEGGSSYQDLEVIVREISNFKIN